LATCPLHWLTANIFGGYYLKKWTHMSHFF
jgi:hypothetical protein